LSNANVSLIVFVVVVALDVCGLALDYLLLRLGAETITEFAHDSPLWGTLLVGTQFVGAFSLLVHFREYGRS
jgi:hypothetical protein